MPSQDLNGLAIQGVDEAHRAVTVREVHNVIGDRDPVREQERSVPPRAEEFAIPVEDDDWWVFALEGVNPILRVGGHRTDLAKGLSRGQFRPVLDDRIGVPSRAHGRHVLFPPAAALQREYLRLSQDHTLPSWCLLDS